MKNLLLLLLLLLVSCQSSADDAANVAAGAALDENAGRIARQKDSLAPFFQPMRVEEGDWLDGHPEDGETFEQYIASSPTLPTTTRSRIYIVPIGEFRPEQMEVIKSTTEYMKVFFNLPVVLRDARPIGQVPGELKRVQFPDNTQIRTTYFIDTLLPPLLPPDAAALICFTNFDLFPGDSWNYVFGQASLNARVGVWSLWRLERENGDRASRELFLARTLKVAMHETGHMFSMRHCTKYECLMSGTNHLAETDRRPLDTCPECTAKVAWAMKYPMEERYRRLAEFWRGKGSTESASMTRKREAIMSHGGR